MSENQAKPKRRVFTGEWRVSVDKQRRLVMPRAWRLASDDENTTFYLMPNRDNTITVMTESQMDDILDMLDDRSLMNRAEMADVTSVAHRILAVTLDSQGRFQLNQDLANHAKIKDSAVCLGSLRVGTIRNAENWEATRPAGEAGFDGFEHLEDLVRERKERKEMAAASHGIIS